MRKKIKKTFSEKAIAKRIAKLGATIRKDAGDSHVLLLGILKGASFFLADLARAIRHNSARYHRTAVSIVTRSRPPGPNSKRRMEVSGGE